MVQSRKLSANIVITIPQKFNPEIKYTFEILMQEFLGQACEFIVQPDAIDYKIEMPGIRSIIIKNSFFINYDEPAGYLTKVALPQNVFTWTDPNLFLNHLPVLYGAGQLKETNSEIILHADLIASSYFMLSRWEEVIDEEKDQHLRSVSATSIAYQNNFLDRPVVNEYADLLWLLMIKAGYTGVRKIRNFECVVTHDVDQQLQWPDWYSGIKHLGGDLIKRKDFGLFTHNLKSLIQTRIFNHQDPYDQHGHQLDVAERHNIRACFNFMVSHTSPYDQPLSYRDPRMIDLIYQIETRGHQIGFHPGYESYLDAHRFNQELNTLQNMVRQKIVTGRHHFLRFKVPYTWRLWEQAGMEWESTLGYADMPGFRCGTCYSYTVFDCLERKKLKLKEKPLMLMDATLAYYLSDWKPEQMLQLRDQCKKHGGEWVTIWHNDLVMAPELADFERFIF